MKFEYDALFANNTWYLVSHPYDHNVIVNKWVYRIKQNLDNLISRYKAHLVARASINNMGLTMETHLVRL